MKWNSHTQRERERERERGRERERSMADLLFGGLARKLLGHP